MVRETPALSRAVLEAAEMAGTPHVIDISSAIVFEPHTDGRRYGVTDVDSPRWEPTDRAWRDPYLASKVLADAEAERARDRGLAVSSVHPALVLGPEDRRPGTSGALLLSLLHAVAVPDVMAGWCDVRDVADAVLAIAERPPGGRYMVTSETLPFRSVCRTLDRITGHQPRRVFLPPRLVGSSRVSTTWPADGWMPRCRRALAWSTCCEPAARSTAAAACRPWGRPTDRSRRRSGTRSAGGRATGCWTGRWPPRSDRWRRAPPVPTCDAVVPRRGPGHARGTKSAPAGPTRRA